MPTETSTHHESSLNPRQDWRPLHKANYKPWSLAFQLFPDQLEGRYRPTAIMGVPLYEARPTQQTINDALRPEGWGPVGSSESPLVTVGAILTLSPGDLIKKLVEKLGENNGKIMAKNVTRQVSHYLHSLQLTPHARLLEDIFNKTQDSIPPDEEEGLMSAVDTALELLPTSPEWKRDQGIQVIQLKYGLIDAKPLPQNKIVAMGVPVSPARVGQIVRQVRGYLHNPRISRYLTQYLSTAESSVARRAYGIAFEHQVDHLAGTVDELELPDELIGPERIFEPGAPIDFVLQDRTTGGLLGDDQLEVVKQSLDKFRRRYREREVFGDLLPEVGIAADDNLRVLKGLPIADLSFSRFTKQWFDREGIFTLGHALEKLTEIDQRSMPPDIRKDLVEKAGTLLIAAGAIETDLT